MIAPVPGCSGAPAMTEPIYRFRPSLLRKQETYRLSDTALVRDTEDGKEKVLPFAQMRSVRVYGSPGLRAMGGTAAPDIERCVLRPARGRAVVLSSAHFLGLGRLEDRSPAFRPFVGDLVRRLAAANPGIIFLVGMPPALWWSWILILLAVVVVTPLVVLLIIVNMVQKRHIDPPLIAVTAVLLGILFSLGSYLRTVRRNRPPRFDPGRTPGGAGLPDWLRG
ncbi:MAG: hypothetical protein IRY94_08585 [Rhodospirillaceae bacterium]|nr:hypothetical protein [Rhodospirillaceae bacterium]